MRKSNLNKNNVFYDNNKNIKKILATEDDVPPLLPSNHTNIISMKNIINKKRKRRTRTRKSIKKRTNTRKRRTIRKR